MSGQGHTDGAAASPREAVGPVLESGETANAVIAACRAAACSIAARSSARWAAHFVCRATSSW